MAKSKIKQMADELYQDDTLSAAVVADAESKGTTRRIEKGELTLPHPIEARRWLQKQMEEKQAHDEEDE